MFCSVPSCWCQCCYLTCVQPWLNRFIVIENQSMIILYYSYVPGTWTLLPIVFFPKMARCNLGKIFHRLNACINKRSGRPWTWTWTSHTEEEWLLEIYCQTLRKCMQQASCETGISKPSFCHIFKGVIGKVTFQEETMQPMRTIQT